MSLDLMRDRLSQLGADEVTIAILGQAPAGRPVLHLGGQAVPRVIH